VAIRILVMIAMTSCLQAEPAIVCGDLLCPSGSVCRADGTCTPRARSPRTLAFDNTSSTIDLVDFPVLVPLGDREVDYDQIVDPARDLGFHDPATGEELAFEIERWDPAGESLVWVRVPRIDAGSRSDTITLTFGPGANLSTYGPQEVWAAYDLVVHGGVPLRNAASDAYAPTASGVSSGEGRVASAVRFEGPGFRTVQFTDSGPLLSGWDTFTFELWLYADYADGNLASEPVVLGKLRSARLGRLIGLGAALPFVRFQIDIEFTTLIQYVGVLLRPRVWTHVVYTYDGSALWIYRDGGLADIGLMPAPSPLVSDASDLMLGTEIGEPLRGAIDELRISRAYMPPDWITAQVLAMNRRFVTFL
jgi:hypothetical protein